ncbi:TetR/AcrR family transcriptional regulator [Haloactinomyces albus]|uniref:AcrR family transcriptional regulator n=1 Tax=Haloactinomyces albus TaxID=1352928 RepID=A0AAE4CNP1_9ACTN|nr:WHG domain-containing protein [Haloactinomyces albus]MDR7303671.1 AcrR family transcriptional regulator [Haloactinomyces albus]
MPRAGLSTEVIVEEAARVVDQVGRNRLTLAELAKRFGVAQPSLYKHVDGLEDLHRLLSMKVMYDMGDIIRRASTGKAGADALRAVANAYRSFALAHPGHYTYVFRTPTPGDTQFAAATDDVLSVLYAVFEGYGISGEDVVDAARFVRSTLHGFVRLELDGGFEMPYSIDRSFEHLIEATDQALANW